MIRKVVIIMNYEQIDMLEFVKSNGNIQEIKDEEVVEEEVKTTNTTQDNSDKTVKILTLEEYEELCQRFANNEKLSLDELRSLKASTPELMEEQGMVLRQKEGYSSISLSFYFVIFFVILCLIASALMYLSVL